MKAIINFFYLNNVIEIFYMKYGKIIIHFNKLIKLYIALLFKHWLRNILVFYTTIFFNVVFFLLTVVICIFNN